MSNRTRAVALVGTLGSVALLAAFQKASPAPEDELVAVVRAFASMPQPADWRGIEQLPGIRWAALPPVSLSNCAPDGSCFARQGAITIGGRQFAVAATGARTMVFQVYLRNGGAPLGVDAVIGTLRNATVTVVSARCPVRGSRGTTTWYRLGGANLSPVVLAVQPPNARGVGEGFVLSSGAELPKLQPNQLALYSEQCEPGAVQRRVATGLPHEAMAATLVSLLVPASGPAAYDWKTVSALPSGIVWDTSGPKRIDLSYRNDRNPFSLGGQVSHGGRDFSVLASGTQTQVRTIYFDEAGLHPRGEHMLGVVFQKGIAVQLSRCGPVYSGSTNNWYALSSARTRPAMIRQSIRYDGNQVQDTYELRVDGSLPQRDPRDRQPGLNGCQ